MVDLLKKLFSKTPSASPSKAFDTKDLIGTLKNAFFFGAGPALAYLAQHLAGVDYGIYTPIVGVALSTLVDAARKWITDNTPKA